MCERTFEKRVQLGGHTSKMHKGQSESYKIKQKIRAEREEHRNFRKMSKKMFFEQYNFEPRSHRDQLKLRAIMKDLMKNATL